MATVTDHETGGVFEGVSGTLLDYYRGEAAADPGRYVIVEDDAAEARFPMVFVDGVRVDDGTVATEGEQVSEGTGEPNVGIEHPADGSWSPTIGNEGAPDDGHPLPGPGAQPEA